MSIHVVKRVMLLKPEALPATARHVLMAMAFHADHDGHQARPAVATTARETSLTRRAVQTSLRLLEERRFIRQTAVMSRGARVYAINLDTLDRERYSQSDADDCEPDSRSAHHDCEPGARGGERGAPPTANVVRGGGASGAPDLSLICPSEQSSTPAEAAGSSDVDSFLTFFVETFKAARGWSYTTGPQDADKVAMLLALFGRERLEAMTLEMFASTDPWITGESDYAIGVLHHRAGRLASRVSSDGPDESAALWARLIEAVGDTGIWKRRELEDWLGTAAGVSLKANRLTVRTHGKSHTELLQQCYSAALRNGAERAGVPHLQIEFIGSGAALKDAVETAAYMRLQKLSVPA